MITAQKSIGFNLNGVHRGHLTLKLVLQVQKKKKKKKKTAVMFVTGSLRGRIKNN